MHNYKALKAASKVSVQKVKVVDQAADEDAGIKERSHEELQVVKKMYSSDTGEAQDDSVRAYSLSEVKREIDRCKADVVRIEASQAEWEQIETDLKAL
jgi:hypothetical protein